MTQSITNLLLSGKQLERQLLENFLREIWQGVINHRNTNGVNTTGVVYLAELALQLKDSLLIR